MNNPLTNFVNTIQGQDYYKCYFVNSKPIIVYEDHRFIVPVLWLAKKNEIIKDHINLFYFDEHHDALDLLGNKDTIRKINSANNFNEVFDIVKTELSLNNDTWLRTLMHLKIVKDAVVVGNKKEIDWKRDILKEWVDLGGEKHISESFGSLEGAFDYQGALSDLAKDYSLKPMWNIIGWEHTKEAGFFMLDEPILLDFDLDYFTFEWRSRHYAWRDDFYDKEFNEISQYFSTRGWSGNKFINKLIQRTQFITIAKESNCCGGEKESNRTLRNLSERFFNGVIP